MHKFLEGKLKDLEDRPRKTKVKEKARRQAKKIRAGKNPERENSHESQAAEGNLHMEVAPRT